jgi:hypothetical protein
MTPPPSQPISPVPTGALARGTVLATYPEYEQAQELVARLAETDFELEKVSIVGRDLVNIEHVVRKLSYPQVALSSAVTGMTMGLLIGIALTLFLPDHNWGSIVPMVIIGGCLWVITNVLGYSLRRSKRDFLSQTAIVATSYDVVVAPEFAAEARQALGQHPSA